MNYNGYGNQAYTYNPYMPQNTQAMMMNNQQNQQNPQIQNSGYVEVSGYQEVVNYPVACATSVNLIDLQAMKFYVKKRGFSSFDQPVIESYTLVKDENKDTAVSYATPEDIKSLRAEIASVKADIDKMKEGEASNE